MLRAAQLSSTQGNAEGHRVVHLQTERFKLLFENPHIHLVLLAQWRTRDEAHAIPLRVALDDAEVHPLTLLHRRMGQRGVRLWRPLLAVPSAPRLRRRLAVALAGA